MRELDRGDLGSIFDDILCGTVDNSTLLTSFRRIGQFSIQNLMVLSLDCFLELSSFLNSIFLSLISNIFRIEYEWVM